MITTLTVIKSRRHQTRTQLKEQLDSVERPHQKFVKMVEESQKLAEEDRKGAELEKQKLQEQRSEMTKFRDGNKMVRNQHGLCMDITVQCSSCTSNQMVHAPLITSHLLFNTISTDYSTT